MFKVSYGTMRNKLKGTITEVKAPCFGINPMDALIGGILTLGGIFMLMGGSHTKGVNNGLDAYNVALNECGLAVGVPTDQVPEDYKEAE